MGCDIHFYREIKKNNKWEAIDEFYVEAEDEYNYLITKNRTYVNRNYNLFSFISDGVRGTHYNSLAQKGFPEDASNAIKEIYNEYGSDAHSASHLTLEELKEAFVKLLITKDKNDIFLYPAVLNLIKRFDKFTNINTNNLRAVFWFDN